MRGILISTIYHKSLRLSIDDLDAAAAVTLMTADVTGMADLVSFSYDSWARVLEVCAGIAILGAVAGAATVFTIIPVMGKCCLISAFKQCADDLFKVQLSRLYLLRAR